MKIKKEDLLQIDLLDHKKRAYIFSTAILSMFKKLFVLVEEYYGKSKRKEYEEQIYDISFNLACSYKESTNNFNKIYEKIVEIRAHCIEDIISRVSPDTALDIVDKFLNKYEFDSVFSSENEFSDQENKIMECVYDRLRRRILRSIESSEYKHRINNLDIIPYINKKTNKSANNLAEEDSILEIIDKAIASGLVEKMDKTSYKWIGETRTNREFAYFVEQFNIHVLKKPDIINESRSKYNNEKYIIAPFKEYFSIKNISQTIYKPKRKSGYPMVDEFYKKL